MKWTSLRHNGVAFPPAYDYRGLVVKIKNQHIRLDARQEEMLMAWAKKKDTPYVQDPVFQRNFLASLAPTLPDDLREITLADIDWTELHAIADREKTANLSDEEKKRRSAERKAVREELKNRYGTARIDETETEIGAYLVEPPGILMGRGAHPLRGKWKERVEPEQVTLNLDEEAPVPSAPEGHTWGKIVHDHDSMWIASWYDKLSDKRKYVWLADSSHLRQERDKEKYLKAAKLESAADRVRREIARRMHFEDAAARASLDHKRKQLLAKKKDLETKLLQARSAGDAGGRAKLEDQLDAGRVELEKLEKRGQAIHAEGMKTRQLATVCYLIDRLSMRVGDEKDEDEADTVGASTLRVEHIHIGRDRIEFNFLGKDSVEWHKSLPLDHDEAILANNLQDFMRGKQPGDQIFDKIDSTHVNRFLSGIVPGLTAKVFRTYHATIAVRAYLESQSHASEDSPLYEKEYEAKLANLEAAVVCNHKRTPPKNWEENLAKRQAELQKLRNAPPDVRKLEAQYTARELAVQKLMAAPPNPQKLEQQVQARERALHKLQAAQAALPRLDEKVKARQAELDKLTAQQTRLEAAAKDAPDRKRAAATARAAETRAGDDQLKRIRKRVASAKKALDLAQQARRKQSRSLKQRIAKEEAALAQARRAVEEAPARYAERVAKAQETLENARRAPETAQKNFQDRVEKATLQLELARRTRDYNLSTSLKNYIDPRVFKAWGDYVGFDWKRLYTTALQRKFAWVEHERAKWRAAGDGREDGKEPAD